MSTPAKQFICSEPGCDKSYIHHNGLITHRSKEHSAKYCTFICQVAGWGKACVTQGAIKQHVSKVHKDEDDSGFGAEKLKSSSNAPPSSNRKSATASKGMFGSQAGWLNSGGSDSEEEDALTNDEKFECPFGNCTFTAKDVSGLGRHMETKHSGDLQGPMDAGYDISDSENDHGKDGDSPRDQSLKGPISAAAKQNKASSRVVTSSNHENKPSNLATKKKSNITQSTPSRNILYSTAKMSTKRPISSVYVHSDSDEDLMVTQKRRATAYKQSVRFAKEDRELEEEEEGEQTPLSMIAEKRGAASQLQSFQKATSTPKSRSKGSNSTSTPRIKASSTPKVSATPKMTKMGPAGYARAVMQYHVDEDPKPSRRAIPKDFEDTNWSDTDDEEDEIDNGDSSTDEDYDDAEYGDEQKGRPRPRKTVRNISKKPRGARKSTGSNSDDSDEEEEHVRPSARPVAPVLSQAAKLAKLMENPYDDMPSLQHAPAAGLRNNLLLPGRRTDHERAHQLDLIYNEDQPRGIIPEDGDLDSYMHFPPARPKLTADQVRGAKMMKLQTAAFIKAREKAEHFPEVRMQFHSDVIAPDIIALERLVLGDHVAAPVDENAYPYPEGRGDKPRVHKKLGSRSKLGPLHQKRAYNWKDPEKEQVRAEKQAKKLAMAVATNNLAPPKAPLPRKKGGKIDRYPAGK